MRNKLIFDIHVSIYRLTVIVAHGVPVEKAMDYARRNGCMITDAWLDEVIKHSKEASGITVNPSETNTDVLVWIRNKLSSKSSAAAYGTLYHELFHAVEKIAEQHAFENEREAKAYLYEYLATRCNERLWI